MSPKTLRSTGNTIQVSEIERTADFLMKTIPVMPDDIRMLSVELERIDGLIINFLDGTTAGYVVEELLEFRPSRKPVPELGEG